MCVCLCVSLSLCVCVCVWGVSLCLCVFVSGCVSFSLCLDSTWEATDRKPEWLGMVLCIVKLGWVVVPAGMCRGHFLCLGEFSWQCTTEVSQASLKGLVPGNLQEKLYQLLSGCALKAGLFRLQNVAIWMGNFRGQEPVTEKGSSRRSLKWNVLFLLWPPDALKNGESLNS